MEEEAEERSQNCGFTQDETDELLCQGIKPWDSEAHEALMVLHGGFDDYGFDSDYWITNMHMRLAHQGGSQLSPNRWNPRVICDSFFVCKILFIFFIYRYMYEDSGWGGGGGGEITVLKSTFLKRYFRSWMLTPKHLQGTIVFSPLFKILKIKNKLQWGGGGGGVVEIFCQENNLCPFSVLWYFQHTS